MSVCSDLLAYVPAWLRVLVHARFPNLHRHRTTEIKLPGKGMAEPHTTCTSWSPFPSPHIKRAEEKEALISIKATHLGTHIEMPVTHINDHLPFFLSLYLHILYKGRRVVAPGTLHLRYISVTQVTSGNKDIETEHTARNLDVTLRYCNVTIFCYDVSHDGLRYLTTPFPSIFIFSFYETFVIFICLSSLSPPIQ